MEQKFMKNNRFVFIHGNQTNHWSNPWTISLKQELEKRRFEIFFETFPDSILARAQYWLPFLEKYARAGKDDVVIGWSSGAVAAMRYAETHPLNGSILIGPSYTDLGDEIEKQSGYYDTPWHWKAIKKHQEKIALFYGDDDPYISQQEFEYIASELQPEVHKIHGGKHFIEYETFPELVAYIEKTYGKGK